MATTSKKKPKPCSYELIVTIGKETYTSRADDAKEALLALKVPKLNARATFTLKHDGKSATLQKNVFHARRALNSPLGAFVLARNLTTLLK